MTALSYITPPCCAHPSIANMDHARGLFAQPERIVNRMCLRCGQHWYGNDGVAVVEFTRAAWDRWINSVDVAEKAA